MVMINTHPRTRFLFLSKNLFWVTFWMLPVWSIFFYMSWNLSWGFIFVFMGGVIYWTFCEYLIHRFLYHVRFKNTFFSWFWGSFHTHHHAHLSDFGVLNAGPGLIWPIAFLLWLLPWFFSGLNVSFSFTWMFGTVTAYYFYEWVHFCIHLKKFNKGYLAWIQRIHLHHHYCDPSSNFGNTSYFWDWILGTHNSTAVYYDLKHVKETHLKVHFL